MEDFNLHNNSNDITLYFFEQAKKMMHNSKMHEDSNITPENIFQEAHKTNREILFKTMKYAHLDGSTILGVENILNLYELSQSGKSCIILSEHLSNLDVPSLFTRFYDHLDPKLKEIFEKFIFIAGVKLNETPLVKLFTEMFTRIVIVPIRSIENMLKEEEKFKKEIAIAKKINLKATRKIFEIKNKGYIFILYPAGTRYRPWNPDTKRGIKETTSYLNSFDYFCCCSINGNNMPPREHEDMTREPVYRDVVVFNFGKVTEAKTFIEDQISNNKIVTEDKEYVKQFIVDRIMEEIEKLHNEAEEYRKKYLI